jgi:catechol 2,3-dioxygenase-like lactoylglutathione lyase family enzyme
LILADTGFFVAIVVLSDRHPLEAPQALPQPPAGVDMRGFVHHVDLTVVDPAASRPFYTAVLGFLGYRIVNEKSDGYDFDLHDDDGNFCSIGIVRARAPGRDRRHDRYSPGLHHLALHAATRAEVDALHALLVEIGARVLDPPADYPQYGAGYYAVFFADPDGLKLELVHQPPI